MKKIILFILLLMMAVNMPSPLYSQPEASGRRIVLLSKGYMNHAWGFNWSGILIDNHGFVYRFEFGPKDMEIAKIFQDDLISSKEMDTILAASKKSEYVVKPDILTTYQDLIEPASTALITCSDGGMRDAGSRYYAVFKYDAARDEYRQIDIEAEGDWRLKSEDENVKKIVGFLDECSDKEKGAH